MVDVGEGLGELEAGRRRRGGRLRRGLGDGEVAVGEAAAVSDGAVGGRSGPAAWLGPGVPVRQHGEHDRGDHDHAHDQDGPAGGRPATAAAGRGSGPGRSREEDAGEPATGGLLGRGVRRGHRPGAPRPPAPAPAAAVAAVVVRDRGQLAGAVGHRGHARRRVVGLRAGDHRRELLADLGEAGTVERVLGQHRVQDRRERPGAADGAGLVVDHRVDGGDGTVAAERRLALDRHVQRGARATTGRWPG